jgi:hypothetical protein
MLDENKLQQWISQYNFYEKNPKRIGIIAAGNIPLVCFHDLLCVLISGNLLVLKFSSKDKVLPQTLLNLLIKIEPKFKKLIEITDEKIFSADAVIATGSDSTLKFFEESFGNIPHIFRQSRSSIAIIKGNESDEQLSALCYDMFSFFGLGCRNVSKIFVPQNYNFTKLCEAAKKFSYLKNHQAYLSAYRYNKAFLAISEQKFIDNDFWLLCENSEFFSPVSVVYFEKYSNLEFVKHTLSFKSKQIQCVVNLDVDFGNAQKPQLNDYADGIDTMDFLSKL